MELEESVEGIDNPQSTFKEILLHVVLPRVLPNVRSQYQEEQEQAILLRLTEIIESNSEWMPSTTVRFVQSLKRVHSNHYDKVEITKEINGLKPGDTFGMFIYSQHTAIMIHMLKDESDDKVGSVIVSTFPASVRTEKIYKGPRDLGVTYPVQSLKMNYSQMMRSEAFANQLCHLYDTSTIGRKCRNIVETWLLTILSDEDTDSADFPKITKKIRDESIGIGRKQTSAIGKQRDIYGSTCFRRSRFYMVMKVFLHHNLSLELGLENGRFIYKIIMLQFMTGLCKEFEDVARFPELDVDLMGQFIAKMARRIEKLANTAPEVKTEFYKTSVDQAKETIFNIRKRIDQQIQNLQLRIEQQAQLHPLKDLNFEEDVKQQVPKLRQYIKSREALELENKSQKSHNLWLSINPIFRHKMDQTGNPNLGDLKACTNEISGHLLLTDIENWILYELSFEETLYSCMILRELYIEYIRCAEPFHANDPIGTSKMLLVRLKVLAIMDRITTEIHPLYLEHKTGIDDQVFDILLLPQAIDMQIAFELQNYIRHRNEQASFPGLIENVYIISTKSFSVRFARINDEMNLVRKEILRKGELKVEMKKREWNEAREKLQSIQIEVSGLTCTSDTMLFSHQHSTGNCRRCLLQMEIASLKVCQIEKPLPEHEDYQYDIVFELRIPAEIAALRDVLHCTTRFGQKSDQKVKVNGNVIQNYLISKYCVPITRFVHLGSTSTTFLKSLSPDNTFNTFVVLNGWNCIIHASGTRLHPSMNIAGIKKRCTLAVETESPYAGLQWTLDTTNHTQNEVLARQSTCPQNLSLSAFKEFGSLRADGHRLQLRKLFATIETEALAFEQPSVLSLVLQTIWETGITGGSGCFRESHQDFTDPKFSTAMVDLLHKFIDLQKANWAHPIKLLIATLITVRIFELNGDRKVAELLVGLLNKLRKISVEWMEKIECSLRTMHNRVRSTEEYLRSLLIFVSITGAMTFFVNSSHKFFDEIFKDNPSNGFTAPKIWLMSIITLNNNILLNNASRLQPLVCKFTRLVRYTGIHIESKIRKMVRCDHSDVFELIKGQWSMAGQGNLSRNYFSRANPQIYVADVEIDKRTKKVTLDIITGSFLVDCLPVSRIPTNITSTYLYVEIFGDYAFEVQPDASDSFTTVYKYNGCSYEFRYDTTVIEHHPNGGKMELIAPGVLENDIPEFLVNNYSHWWSKSENIVRFRPKKFNHPNFFNDSGLEYILDLNTNRLIQTKTRRCMLDIRSNSFHKILCHLARLERQKYIFVLMEDPHVATIELVRMNLKFKIDSTKSNEDGSLDMLSNEFSRMKVSLNQNCGTLYKLNHGLLLESVTRTDPAITSSKFLLLPHSNVQIFRPNSEFAFDIKLDDELRNPPFHRYQVDELLRQLKPSNGNFSAWFYLAYLHAMTSHGEIEPLTGMSGTERALQILQSSVVFSSAPYDSESIKTLDFIAQLSPKRCINESIQWIDWPSVPEHCAQDSYVFIVQKLLEDSQKLNELHFKKAEPEPLITMPNPQLNVRDYFRCLQLKPNLRVKDIFIKHKVPRTRSVNIPPIESLRDVGLVSYLHHTKKYFAPDFSKLKLFFKSKSALDGPINIGCVPSILEHNVTTDFRNMWFSLYEAARFQHLDNESFGLLWSFYACERVNVHALLVLQVVANNPELFKDCNPPLVCKYVVPDATFSSNKKLVKSLSFLKKKEIDRITKHIDSCWPCDNVDLTKLELPIGNVVRASSVINEQLQIWNHNQQLADFILEIECILSYLLPITEIDPPNFNFELENNAKNWSKYEIDFEAKMIDNLSEFEHISAEAKKVWHRETDSISSSEYWWSMYKCVSVNSEKHKHLIDAGIYPRMVPSMILPRITCKKTNTKLKDIIGALAIAIAREQRLHRIKAYAFQPQLKPNLDREMENEPHVNWRPCDYPEWLLFEIEQNLTIRRIQIEIAKRMINPPGSETKHSVMQLNMGEGKTAVIVPIVAAILADGNKACQIIVLKSLFATNLNSLRQYLGGLLGRRVYTVPCRRDMAVGECINNISEIYEECRQMKGVILTLPEYLLSFQLKIYETVQKGEIELSKQLLSIHMGMNKNIRSILDESDAVLSPKHQLVYTVGNQLPLDGDENRWIVAQAILKRVPFHMKRLQSELGKNAIEFHNDYIKSGPVFSARLPVGQCHRPDVFTPCRLLDGFVYERIKLALIDDFLDGRLNITFVELSASVRNLVRRFLSEKEIDRTASNDMLNELAANHRNILMILSGLLRFEVLKLVLTKRWRVNFGVNENGNRKMAIPFRAKDKAADMTEFGHPDVAICLTQLSYYYSGLTDDQLTTVFEALEIDPNAPEIYAHWISSIPPELVDPSIRQHSSINLKDFIQKNDIIFLLFRFNMHVIDFWLSFKVYPHEAKSFEKKLMCSAWDLCTDHMENAVTGFSGTNDTKNVLPLPIVQNDLEELEHTNENVRKTLLLPENQTYQPLPPNVSGKMILERLIAGNIPVLLDAGALMLELSNDEMAQEWLKLAAPEKFDAAVYFDSKDVLQTIDRNGIVAEFDSSVHSENLIRCLVYLDDVHTRGTDLKFPLGWTACVTLSGDIARDKTVQACMRMRQLGKGHSITFWASHEADLRIREMCNLSINDSVNNEHVVEFIGRNSKIFETKNIVHWAASGYNYTKKLVAHKLTSELSTDAVNNLFENCVDDEFVTLREMYGDESQLELPEMYGTKFTALEKLHEKSNQNIEFIQKIKVTVCQKLKDQVSESRQFMQCLDEEQEKELEQQFEEQRQIERPTAMSAAIPHFDTILMKLFTTEEPEQMINELQGSILFSLHSSLSNTQLLQSYMAEDNPWSENVFVTRDFVQVLNTESQSCDEFLRPVQWIGCIIQSSVRVFWILLSSFECEHLLSTFQKSKRGALLMYRPRKNRLHDNLLRERYLWITAMTEPMNIDTKMEVAVGVYAGSMYFETEAEQSAFCKFLGLIPRPRPGELEVAFENEIIKPNGFVLPENRQHSEIIAKYVGDCRFVNNPVELVIRLIVAHHGFMSKKSHVAAIVDRGLTLNIDEEWEDIGRRVEELNIE